MFLSLSRGLNVAAVALKCLLYTFYHSLKRLKSTAGHAQQQMKMPTLNLNTHFFCRDLKLKVGCLFMLRGGAGGGAGSVQVVKRPHLSRRCHKRSDVLLFPSRYNGVKISKYLSGID